jgi:hypothetical protein
LDAILDPFEVLHTKRSGEHSDEFGIVLPERYLDRTVSH